MLVNRNSVFISLFLFLSSLFFSTAAYAAVTPYEASHIDRPSPLYEVKVDGIPVDVVYMDKLDRSGHGDTHYAQFEQSGSAVVEVTFWKEEGNGTVTAVDINPNQTRIRPFARDITPQISGNKMTFTVPKAEKLIVEINMPFKQDFSSYNPGILYLFGEEPETNRPPSSGNNIKNAGQLGIEQAFSQAVAGDTIYVPRGKYVITQTLTIDKDNITLYMEPGAFITIGAVKFPVSADSVNNLTIRGRGTIESAAPGLAISRVNNFLLEDVLFRNAACPSVTGFFTLIFSTNHATIRNAKTVMLPPQDGGGAENKCGRAAFVFNSNQNLLVENSFFESHEDGTALKSFEWGGLPGRQTIMENKNITLRNNIMWGGHDIGTELNDNVTNILWQSNTIISGSFSIMSARHNTLSNIRYSFNTIESPGTEQFVKIGSDFRDTIKPNSGDLDVRFENLTVGKVWQQKGHNPNNPETWYDGFVAAGDPGTRQNITFHNLKVEGHCIMSLQDLRARGYNPVVTEDVNLTFTKSDGCTETPPPSPTPDPSPSPSPTPPPTDPPPTESPTPPPTDPPVKEGDANRDGVVDIFDYSRILEYFGRESCEYNLNSTCLIDIFDYSEVIENFGL